MKHFIVSLCFILLTTVGFSQSQKQILLKGTVKDCKAVYLSKVLVTLYSGDGIAIKNTVTDNEGKFSLLAPIGNYHLIASLNGYIAEENLLIITEKQLPQKNIKTIILKNNTFTPPSIRHIASITN
ncbi:carboxypeptidase family protein [Chitinophaga polysaccharea]|uniref:Carboxypeptidase family protein n=1 Tax=Chitinophaga polysaccharea TaxID=1293035 RepID=A0A561P0W8_9BACT|nr:carboxypeptidase-like regulatory domain-containing protein [Chitinophaga polysaccharea]TWF31710.1 carboxypeptidase family protein [Chitinophaga polysaccharea]